jgi:Heparinase II/III-like protein/Heparinase II/III N-terminus
MSPFSDRLRRAAGKTPRQIAVRLAEMSAGQLQRPWSRVYPHLVTDRALLDATGSASLDALWQSRQRAPFFVSSARRDEWTRAFRERYPQAADALVRAADRAIAHEFDLLGSGAVALGPQLPWHTDFKSGREWPMGYSPRLEILELDRPSDVKMPWELNRCQHFTALGQAYWLTGDERYAQEFVDEVSDWIPRNPWAHGVNWVCAMDVALRAVSWIWAFHFFGDAVACRAPEFRGALLRSLFLHGDYIAGHLERGEINGNHYLCDGVGLVFLGAFFRDTRKGQDWLRVGREIVESEIFTQTSDDGVDFEKSTAYQRLVLEAFLTSHLLLSLHGEPLNATWVARLERMLEYVESYTKPDGTIPLVGDADDGRVQKLGVQPINDHRYLLAVGAVLSGRGDFKRAAGTFSDEAFWLLGPPAVSAFEAIPPPSAPIRSTAFDGGGVYVLRTDRAHVFVDCGEVGMHGRGGHGHSDITSVEIWLDGLNLVTDCGAYLYSASREWRNAFRSTAFHNVVQVDGEELCRLISPDNLWQLRDDARPRDIAWKWGDRADYFRGGHDGYARLDPPVSVLREIVLLKDGPDVVVRDTLDGRGTQTLVSRFHLDPALTAAVERDGVVLRAAGRRAWLQPIELPPGSHITIEDGWVSPTYGVRVPAQVVALTVRTTLPAVMTWRIGLTDLSPAKLASLLTAVPARDPDALAAR